MSKRTRQQKILDYLNQHGESEVTDLAGHFEVSDMTIRRDLDEMAERNRVIRTHGGASPAGRVAFDFQFMQREGLHAADKNCIATTAAKLVKPGMSVLLDSGTTTLAVARALKGIPQLTIITSSLPIASELQYVEGLEVLLLGGTLRRESPDLIGPLTEYGLEKVHADLAFLGAEAIDEQGKVYSDTLQVARLLRIMMGAADKVYLVADASKVGAKALGFIDSLKAYDGFITNGKLSGSAAKTYRSLTRLIEG